MWGSFYGDDASALLVRFMFFPAGLKSQNSGWPKMCYTQIQVKID